jgi:ABC-type bacteriocin/lantibiotic exporter with double-glycine peptidase domain
LQAVLHLTVELFLLFAIIFVLFFINSKLFLIVTVFSLFIIFLINKFSKKHSYFLGKERERNANFIFKYLNENLSGIKEIIIYSGQKIITNKYLDNLLKLSKSIAKHLNYIEIGRYGLELLGVTLVFLILIIMSIDETISKTNIIETIGVYVLALFRILPLLNRLSTYTQRIRNGHISAEKIYSFINSTEITDKEKKKINLEKKIELKNVTFKYPDQKNLILDNINLEIKKNELIGIFGKSGGGKTTLTNILMGLLQPLSGNIYIDGQDMVKNNLSFSHQSSFLSQDLFSIDSSVINNITLTDEKINISNLKYALRNSMLKTDIAYKRLNLKMNIGDSVKKISGGQLQRINIARALYRRPTLLIMDEPTSALDKDGQKAFSEILLKLKSNITIIVISHDQNLLKNFDKIYKLNNEKLELERNI